MNTLIKGGFIVDGTGSPGQVGDLYISGNAIMEIAPEINKSADKVIHADHFVVAPGFIDSHVHSDASILSGYSSWNALEQGITTQINGHCGAGPAPMHTELENTLRHTRSKAFIDEMLPVCRDFHSFTAYVSSHRYGTNMAFYAPHGNIRAKVMDYHPGKASKSEMAEMKALLREAMECGYLGMSTGLIFAPSSYAGTEELIELSSVLTEYNGRYTSHIRGEGTMNLDSIAEAIEIGRQDSVPVIISHLKIRGKQSWGRSAKILSLLDQARQEGLDVYADQYPYTAGCAGLIDQIPPTLHEGGTAALLARLNNPNYRDTVEKAIFGCLDGYESNVYQAGYEGTLIALAKMTPQRCGKTIAEIAHEENKRCIDVLCDLLIDNSGDVTGIYFTQSEEDMKVFLKHPFVMGCTDAQDVPAADRNATSGTHPRAIGAFVRRLSLQRESKSVSLEQAVHRVTALPANAAGLYSIGKLAPGKHADICIFDWERLQDHADYKHPYRKNEGISWVLVGGAIAVKDGEATGVKNGLFLKRETPGKETLAL